MRMLFPWLKRLPTWLRETRKLWLFLFWVIVICLVVDWLGYWLHLPEKQRLPYAGWLLECLGLYIVARDLGRRLELFDQDSLWKQVMQWLRRFPLLRQDDTVHLGAIGLTLESAVSNGRVKVALPAGASDKEKIEFLVRQVDALDDALYKFVQTIKGDIRKAQSELEDQLGQIRAEIESVRDLLAKAQVGEIGLEVVGLGWILLGLTLATVPELVYHLTQPIISLLRI